MIRIFCDRCKTDITEDDQYEIRIFKKSGLSAMAPMVLCPRCKEDIKDRLQEE